MKSRSKIILIIVIISILVLAVAGTVLGYLFLATDTFKSSGELFLKYIAQNKNISETLMNSSMMTTVENAKQQNTYESNTTISAAYSEGGEISNPINNLSVQLQTQKENDYRYRNVQVLYEDTAYLGIEGIRNEDVYGIRFPTALKQFLSIRNSENLEQDATRIGIDLEIIEKCIEIINNDSTLTEMVISREEITGLIERYINIISENLQNATFSKQKNAMVTYNGNTVEANAYIAVLSSEQVQNMIVQILNQVKTDETILNLIGEQNTDNFIQEIDEILENLGIDQEITEIKITVYEQDKITIKTTIELGLESIIIENIQENGQTAMVIQRQVLNAEQEQQQSIKITKISADTQESYNVLFNVVEGDDTYTVEFNIEMTSNNGILTNIGSIKFTQGIVNIEFKLENNINTTQIQEKVELDETNNVILSDLDDENLANVMNVVQSGVPGIIQNQANELIEKLQIQNLIERITENISTNEPEEGESESSTENSPEGETETTPEGEEMSQIEINRFNAKFEFYTGESVSADNVKILLDVVKSNLSNIEITTVPETTENENTTTTENNNQNSEEQIETIKLIIEKDTENIDLANQVLEKIEDGKKYKVEITYKESNGMIDYIMIEEIAE